MPALIGADSIPGIIMVAIGLIMVVTAAVGVCPLYALLRIDTHPASRAFHGG